MAVLFFFLSYAQCLKYVLSSFRKYSLGAMYKCSQPAEVKTWP